MSEPGGATRRPASIRGEGFVSYITQQDLEAELGQKKLIELTNDTRNATEVNPTPVERAITYACGLIDSYARARYSLPLPKTAMVRSLAIDLASFKLYRNRVTSDEGVYKPKRDAFEDAIRLLKSINKGEAALDVPAAEETESSPGSSDRVLSGSKRTVFTDKNMGGY